MSKSKSQIMGDIKDIFSHLKGLPDPFGYIGNDVNDLQRLVGELRSMTTSNNSVIDSLTQERDALRLKVQAQEREMAELRRQNEELTRKANDAITKVNQATLMAERISCFHANFRMESLEKQLGEQHHVLRNKCVAIAKATQAEFNRRRGKVTPEFLMEQFHRNLTAVQEVAQKREDILFDACRNSVISFGLFLCAALNQLGEIKIDEDTRLDTLEFTVDGSFPNVSVRAVKPGETGTTQVKLTEGIKQIAQKVILEFHKEDK